MVEFFYGACEMIEFFNAARDADSPMPLSNALFQALLEKEFVIFNIAVRYGRNGFLATAKVARLSEINKEMKVKFEQKVLEAMLQELAVKRGYVADVGISLMHGQHIIVTPNLPFLRKPPEQTFVPFPLQSAAQARLSAGVN